MDEVDVVVETVPHESTRDRLLKLIVGTTAGFIASKVAEDVVEKFLVNRRKAKL